MGTKDFATWLDHTIRDRGWSRRECARRAGISNTAINRIIARESPPSWAIVAPLAYVLQIPFMSMFKMAGLVPIQNPEVSEDQEEAEVVDSETLDIFEDEVTFFELYEKVKTMSPKEREKLLRFAYYMEGKSRGEL